MSFLVKDHVEIAVERLFVCGALPATFAHDSSSSSSSIGNVTVTKSLVMVMTSHLLVGQVSTHSDNSSIVMVYPTGGAEIYSRMRPEVISSLTRRSISLSISDLLNASKLFSKSVIRSSWSE